MSKTRKSTEITQMLVICAIQYSLEPSATLLDIARGVQKLFAIHVAVQEGSSRKKTRTFIEYVIGVILNLTTSLSHSFIREQLKAKSSR